MHFSTSGTAAPLTADSAADVSNSRVRRWVGLSMYVNPSHDCERLHAFVNHNKMKHAPTPAATGLLPLGRSLAANPGAGLLRL